MSTPLELVFFKPDVAGGAGVGPFAELHKSFSWQLPEQFHCLSGWCHQL
jgi:hypothetical protein